MARFGIVTSSEFALHPVGPIVLGGMLQATPQNLIALIGLGVAIDTSCSSPHAGARSARGGAPATRRSDACISRARSCVGGTRLDTDVVVS